MKVEVNLEYFLPSWKRIERFGRVKSTSARVGYALMTVDGDNATLEATDFKLSVRCTVYGVRAETSGAVLLPIKLLGEFFKKVKCSVVTLEAEGEQGVLKAGRNKLRFPSLNVDDVAVTARSDDAPRICTVDTPRLIKVIDEGIIASPTPSNFPNFLGTCSFDVKNGELRTISTDTKRLSLSKCPCECESEEHVILSIPILKEVRKILATVHSNNTEILYDGATVWFKTHDVELSMKRMDTRFPNFEKIVSKDVTTTLKIAQRELADTLGRVRLLAGTTADRTAVLETTDDGCLSVSAIAKEFGTVNEVIEANIDGEHLTIGFNIDYLEDGVKALGDCDIIIEFNGAEGQVRMKRFNNDDFLYMLAPCRVNPHNFVKEE